MWADWLHNYIPRPRTQHILMSSTFYPDRSEVEKKRRTGDPHSRKIKCVCRPCNNEWMSGMQEKVKPYLSPILENRSIILRRNAKSAISSWVVMMIMVSEYINRDMIAIPSSDRIWFKENQRPPFHWRIWIGHHSAQNHELFSHSVLTLASEEEVKRAGPNAANESNSHSTTILLGDHLLIHAMSSSVASGRRFIRRWKHPAEIAPGLIPIWPTSNVPIAWPPALPYRGLNDAGIRLLANDFLTEGKFLAGVAY